MSEVTPKDKEYWAGIKWEDYIDQVKENIEGRIEDLRSNYNI